MSSLFALTLFLASLQVAEATACAADSPTACAADVSSDEDALLESMNMNLLQVSVSHALNSNSVAQAPLEASQPSGPFRQELTNYRDMQYHGPVTVGGQPMMAVMDTGSFEMVVFTRQCSTCGNTTMYYDGNSSSTNLVTNISRTHNYGSGSASSTLNTDRVSVGPMRTTQDFWAVYRANMPIIQPGRFGVIFGVGPPGTPDTYAAQSLVRMKHMYGSGSQQVAKARRLSSRMNNSGMFVENVQTQVFSICLRNTTGQTGVMVWNDINPRDLPQFTRNAVTGHVTWGLVMQNLQLRHSGLAGGSVTAGCSSPSCGVIMDSGTSLIVVTPSMYQQVFQAVNALHPTCSNLHTLPSLEFNLGGNTYYLPPHAYIGRVNAPSGTRANERYHVYVESLRNAQPVACGLQLLLMQSNMAPTQFGPMTIMGMPFFRQYYTTFDYGPAGASPPQRAIYTSAPNANCNPHGSTGGPGTSFEVNAGVSSNSLPWQPIEVDLDKVTVSQHAAMLAEAEGMVEI